MNKNELFKQFKIYTENNICNFPDKKSNLRILQFNVHNWTDYKNLNSTDKIFKLIKDSNADIVGLNEGLFFSEFKKNKIKEYIKIIGYDHYCESNTLYGINLLFSKYPIVSKQIIKLQKDPVKSQNRYATKATINVQNKNINILLTHLDVYDETEETRFNQIQLIMKNIDQSYILIGDLNSLRKSDYDEKEWDFLKNDCESRNIQIQNKVTTFIENQNFIDVFCKINKNVPKVSVWSMRRVDYCYIGETFPYKIFNCGIYPTLVSDHYPIYVDIEI